MPKGPMGPGKPGAKIENPGKLFIRLMKYVFKYYWVHCLIAVSYTHLDVYKRQGSHT